MLDILRGGVTMAVSLLFRYGASPRGSIEKKAHIYTRAEHGIDRGSVDPDAVWVLRRLRGARFHAYIVGGAVRDLLAGRVPKDFDVATDAHPMQVRRLFRSARVIGRRFRLVHVYCGREKYIEVSTFRSRSALGTRDEETPVDANNSFGTMEEDARRRDFTINALYYCPFDEQLIDYVGAFHDLRQRRLRTLGSADASFAEDPVRMIRAVKYASLLGFPFPAPLAALVRRSGDSILSCSRERVTEEVYKLLVSGGAAGIFELLHRLRLFEVLFPAQTEQLRSWRGPFPESPFGRSLRELDARAAAGTLLPRTRMFAFLFGELARERGEILESPEPQLLLQRFIRGIAAPLFPSRKDLAVASDEVLEAAGIRHRRGERAAAPGPERTPRRRRRGRRGGRRRKRSGTGPA